MAKGKQKDTISQRFLAIRNEKQLFNDYHISVESNIGVRGKSRAPLLMRLIFGFPDDKLFKGACPKSRRDDRTQTEYTPVCVLSHLQCFPPDPNNNQTNAYECEVQQTCGLR